jgi:quercetin dioxygenase-like cupin family protein
MRPTVYPPVPGPTGVAVPRTGSAVGFPLVEARNLTDLVHFEGSGARRERLAETARLFSEVVCLDVRQELGPVADPAADALGVVLAGEVAVQVGRGRKRLAQWGTFVVPAGDELFLRNASPEPAVLLIVTAPPPS